MRTPANISCNYLSLPRFCFIVTFLLWQFYPAAQQLNIRDFVVFGGTSSYPGSSVQIGTSTSVNGGRIGSYQLVKTTGNSHLTSSINSSNRIELANTNTVQGNITAANTNNTSGNIFLTGSNAAITGNVYVNGNVSIGGGSLNGQVIQSTGSTYSGPTPSGGRTTGNPPLPTMPDLPAIAEFEAATNDNITDTRSISSNRYGSITLGGGKTVTFSSPGTYVFSSIKISGNNNKFVLDFGSPQATGNFFIQVWGDVDLDKLNIELKNGGNASRIFMEVHGSGSTSATGKDAWRIANGASGNTQAIWYGTVWAPYGNIVVGSGAGSAKIEGALWSAATVTLNSGVGVTYVQPVFCATPTANAGPDQLITCPATQVNIGTSASSGTGYSWRNITQSVTAVIGTQQVISVSNPGTYVLTAKNPCGEDVRDTVIVGYKSCVEPINQTPNGKVSNLIGAELTNLATNVQEAKKYLVILGANDDSVLIEAIAVIDREAEATTFLVGLGLTNIIPNGTNYQIISGKFPIAKLNDINARPDLINYCRPVFLPLGNSGVVTSEGDRAIGANLARGGFNVDGSGIKVGVISDSYNTLAGDPAQQDIDNGDLPGIGNPDGNLTVVSPLIDYPYGRRSDEGRAMLQIIHDLAPKAPLAFRTGFVSAGDCAQGIIQLKDAGCKVIVDDVTFITEPFFQDGVVSRAVNQVNNEGVAYFTSAGNFGSRSYTSNFRRAPAPGPYANHAHDFGGGDIYQKLKLKSGTYTIVLQWKDNIYSLGQPAGTINDLDIYLVDPSGRIGFNRNNLGGDPLEVLSFSINLPDTSQVIEADLLITKANASTDDPTFKFIMFRGNGVIDEYYSTQSLTDKSTIMGHANAAGSIAVGAVLFSNTPPYGNTPSTASFSSTGGTPVFNAATSTYEIRMKPELTAPNGVNTSTTVPLGPDNDGSGNSDGFPNFFGTSASAPHAAAAAALVMQARQKFYGQALTAPALKEFLFNSALTMQPDGLVGGVNYKAGYGLVQPDAAIRQFASPTPNLISLGFPSTPTPGTAAFTLTVTGDYLSNNSVIYLRGTPLSTTRISEHELQAEVQPFGGNPSIRVYTPPLTNSGDGGFSNTLYFFDLKKDTITIVADNKSKKYGEALPPNTTTILVNGDSLHVYNQKKGTNLTRADLGVAESEVIIRYTNPNVNALSDVGIYQVRASRPFNAANTHDAELQERYYYDSTFGALQISKLAVTVAPRDTSIVYGAPLDNFNFNYTFDPAAVIADPSTLTNIIKASHEEHVDNSVLGVVNNFGGGAVVIFNARVYSVYNNASVVINGKLLPVVLNAAGSAIAIFNGQELPVVNISTGGAVVVFNGTEYPVVNGGSSAVVVFNGQLLPVITSATTGSAVVVFNGQEYPVTSGIAGGGAVVVFNGIEYPVVNGGGGAIVVFNGQYYPVVNGVAGGAVVIFNGQELPVFTNATGSAVVVFNGQEVSVTNGGAGGGSSNL